VDRPLVEASAPVRICDNGGWTDTWFGGPGRILNIAVSPGVAVSIRPTAGPHPVVLDVESFNDRYPVVPGQSRIARHPLLEAAIDAFPPPEDLTVEVCVRSAVPAGAGTGTSAAVAVALVGGLVALRSEDLSPRQIAYAAHRLETEVLGVESGIQDQLSVALGGINYLEVDPYPQATVHALGIWEELSSRLSVVYLGRAHDSSGVHRQVIETLGSRPSTCFSPLREAAVAARDAVVSRDLHAFGQAMIANTEAQKSLHRELVGVDATTVIERAATHRALGWKVNGAGGVGGSVTVLHASVPAKERFEHGVAGSDDRFRVLPVRISPVGLRVRGIRR
jgi:D-glycero-alpha-D-manno-heptose-7-phosphate kinase